MRAAVPLLVFWTAASASGCPLCDSGTGADVRAGIFNASFLVTLVEVLAPFAVLAMVLRILDRHLPK